MSGTKVCPQCGTRYEASQRFCSLDGATLIAEHPADTLTGSVLADRYLVKEKLGEGGMGEVYLAEHVRMRRKVAVKVMRKWLTSDPSAIGRFHREAENASQIAHPNVAAVYDFGETSEGLVYLAMEFVAGEPLTKILDRQRTLNHIRCSDIVSQIADALAAAHAIGILHRDLKPDNVMIAKTRVGTDLVKLLDFGIARVMGRETQHFTSTGMIIGTPDWMSPEQISGDRLDARADIYALGLIAYRMLTGEGAFGSASSQDTLLAKMTKPPRRLSEARPDVEWPESLQNTLDRALASDPQHRYADVLALASDLYYAILQLPMTSDAEAYLAALSQRAVTPTRGLGTVEPTPARGVAGLGDSSISGVSGAFESGGGSRLETPAMVRASEEITAPLAIETIANAPTAEGPATPTVTSSSETASPVFGGAATAPRGRGRRPLVIGVIGAGVLAATALALWVGWRGGVAGSPNDGGVPDSLRANVDTAGMIIVGQTPPSDTVMPIDEVVKRSSPGVFGVRGGKGVRGTGFLADSSGIVLTSASLVELNDTVSVYLDGSRRLLAKVLATDSSADIAALLIPIGRCRGCVALRLSTDARPAKAGDSVVAITAPTTIGARSASRGTLASVSDNRLVASLSSGQRATGGPVLGATGVVVGFTKSGPRTAGNIVNVAAIGGFLSQAADRRSRVQPIDSVPSSWPARTIPLAVLDSAKRRSERVTIDEMSAERENFAVLVMTPQTMAWRRAAAESLKVQGANPFSTEKQVCASAKCDPIEGWASWGEYLSERRAVVVVQVSPKDAKPPNFGATRLIQFRRGNFGSLALLRDNVPVVPIEAQRIYAVPNPQEYAAVGKTPFYSGIYVFNPSAFIGARTVVLNVYDASDMTKAVRIELPDRILRVVANDLVPYVGQNR